LQPNAQSPSEISPYAANTRKAAGSGLFSDVITGQYCSVGKQHNDLLRWMASEDSRADSGQHRRMLGNKVIAGILNLQSLNGSSNARWIRRMA
jgi:hypothetical protein